MVVLVEVGERRRKPVGGVLRVCLEGPSTGLARQGVGGALGEWRRLAKP